MRRFVTRTATAIALLALVYAVPVVNELQHDPAYYVAARHETITPPTKTSPTTTTTTPTGPFARRSEPVEPIEPVEPVEPVAPVEPGGTGDVNSGADNAANSITPSTTIVTTTTTATTTIAITHETIQTTIMSVNQTIQAPTEQTGSPTEQTPTKEPTDTFTRSASSNTATDAEQKNNDGSGSFSTVGIVLTAVGAIVASLCCMFLLYQYARRENSSSGDSRQQRSWIPIAV